MLAAGVAGWMLATSAFAGGLPEAPSLRVSYYDLDLSKDSGVDTLYTRLRHAAGHVCGDRVDIRDLKGVQMERACVARALDNAVESVHSQRLTARHTGAGPALRVAQAD
jgi:UrcA family protein